MAESKSARDQFKALINEVLDDRKKAEQEASEKTRTNTEESDSTPGWLTSLFGAKSE